MNWYNVYKKSQVSLGQQIKSNQKVPYLKGIGAIELDPLLQKVKDVVMYSKFGTINVQPHEYTAMVNAINYTYDQLRNPQFHSQRGMPIINKAQYQKVLPKILQSRQKKEIPTPVPVANKPDVSVVNNFNNKAAPRPAPFGTRLNLPRPTQPS